MVTLFKMLAVVSAATSIATFAVFVIVLSTGKGNPDAAAAVSMGGIILTILFSQAVKDIEKKEAAQRQSWVPSMFLLPIRRIRVTHHVTRLPDGASVKQEQSAPKEFWVIVAVIFVCTGFALGWFQ